jgi:spore coat polysaccharide biosynthesis protein SpsF
MYEAATIESADVVVRITGDCPLISPRAIDAVVQRLRESGADYASNTVKRTLPRGLDVEAFTYDSFSTVEKQATKREEREHVTLYYLRNKKEFNIAGISANEIFDTSDLSGRSDLRLTLDEANDYELLRRIYNESQNDEHLTIQEVVALIDQNGWETLNQDVQQKYPSKTE